MNLTPKQELIVTLEAARDLIAAGGPAEVRMAQIRGLVDHGLALSRRVGEIAKPRRATEPTIAQQIIDAGHDAFANKEGDK